jgi:hypothetical protein
MTLFLTIILGLATAAVSALLLLAAIRIVNARSRR